MGYKKSNYGVYSSLLKVDNVSKETNIFNILKRNKIEEQKEKLNHLITKRHGRKYIGKMSVSWPKADV